jgi:hypothetical protein
MSLGQLDLGVLHILDVDRQEQLVLALHKSYIIEMSV